MKRNPSTEASQYAQKKKEQMERARQLKEERKSGGNQYKNDYMPDQEFGRSAKADNQPQNQSAYGGRTTSGFSNQNQFSSANDGFGVPVRPITLQTKIGAGAVFNSGGNFGQGLSSFDNGLSGQQIGSKKTIGQGVGYQGPTGMSSDHGYNQQRQQPVRAKAEAFSQNFAQDEAYSKYAGSTQQRTLQPSTASQPSSYRGTVAPGQTSKGSQNYPPSYQQQQELDSQRRIAERKSEAQVKAQVRPSSTQQRRAVEEQKYSAPQSKGINRPPSAKQPVASQVSRQSTTTSSYGQSKVSQAALEERSYNQVQAQPKRPASGVPVKRTANGGKTQQQSKYEESEFSNQVIPTAQSRGAGAKAGGGIPRGMQAFQQQMQQNLNECKSCGRSFNEEAFAKHSRICKKVFQTKRKVFNSQAKRIISNEQKRFIQQAQKKGNNNPQQNQAQPARPGMMQLPKWKSQSEQFRQAMRAARGADSNQGYSGSNYGGGQVRGGRQQVQAPVQQYDDRVPCPHCGRKFAEQAAQRHIPHCSEKSKKAAMLGGGKAGGFRR